MSELIIVREFEGNGITFDFQSPNGMINATQMSKPFEGRSAADYLRLGATKELINAIIENENARRILEVKKENSSLENTVQDGNSHLELLKSPILMTFEDVVAVRHGGRNNGTWMHRLLAIDFAGWLSPRFNVWMLKTIDQLLQGKLTEEVGFWKKQYEALAENARQMIEADDLGKEKTKEAKDFFKKSNELKHSILDSLSSQQFQLIF